MNKESFHEANHTEFYSRYIIDMLYWIMINIIFLNIIFGIIIDSFAGLFFIFFYFINFLILLLFYDN